MTAHTGLSPKNPNKYVGPNVFQPIVVSRNREPTGADYRQPETGKLYTFNTFWLVGNNPTTGTYGDIWVLNNIIANVGMWSKISAAGKTGIFSVAVDTSSPPGTNPVLATTEGLITITGGQVAAGTVGANVIQTDSTLANEFAIEIQRTTTNATPDSTKNGVSHFDSSFFTVDSTGFVGINSAGLAETITGDDGVVLDPVLGNWNILGQKNGTIPVIATNGDIPTGTLKIEDLTSTTPFVVDASTTVGSRGTYSTISAAIAAASSGTTIFIKDGIYTENPTLKAGVNLVAYCGEGYTSNVTIVGKCSMTTAGVVSISGIRLQTNGNYAISITGSAASEVYLIDCYLNAADFTHILMSTSSSSARLRIIDSTIDTGTSSYGIFTVTGGGSLRIFSVDTKESVQTNIQSTFASSGILRIRFSTINFPITTSGTGRNTFDHCEFNTFLGDRQSLTIGSTFASGMNNYVRSCSILSGMAAAISISTTLFIGDTAIYSQAAVGIIGSGILYYAGITYEYGNPITNATSLTLHRESFDGGSYVGDFSGTTVSAGYIGEYISSFIPFDGSVASLTTDTTAIVTSITLTPGTWDVSGIVMFDGIVTGTYQNASVSPLNTAIASTTYGDNTTSATFTGFNTIAVGLSIPAFRQKVTIGGGSISMYLKARAGFTVAAGGAGAVAYGRISATRVA